VLVVGVLGVVVRMNLHVPQKLVVDLQFSPKGKPDQPAKYNYRLPIVATAAGALMCWSFCYRRGQLMVDLIKTDDNVIGIVSINSPRYKTRNVLLIIDERSRS
jgi:hypothetical protein